MPEILPTAAFLVFCFLSLLLYVRLKYQNDRRVHAVFWWTLGILAVVTAAKFAVGHFATGYIAGRMVFYARSWPRIAGLYYVTAIVAALCALAPWYRRQSTWPPWFKLSLLWLIAVVFSAGVAGLRDGAAGIAEPFTRTDWEYVADARLVTSIPQFLTDYVASYPVLSMHGKTHPPGNALLLHIVQRAFEPSTFGLALIVVLVGSTLVFPVYFFWRRYLPEPELAAIMPMFMLTPAIVMFSATSMDIVAVPFFWAALLACDAGWQRSAWLSSVGGLAAGVALLLSFQFLVFGLVLLFFFARQFSAAGQRAWQRLVFRGAVSAAAFVIFFVSLWLFTDYSILANYRAAHAYHYSMVEIGSISIGTHLVFALSNLSAFLLYLGIVHGVLLARRPGSAIRDAPKAVALVGPILVVLLVLSGIYQGEAERLWLFLTPLFIPAMVGAVRSCAFPHGAAISLLGFQVVVMQTLFYTYW